MSTLDQTHRAFGGFLQVISLGLAVFVAWNLTGCQHRRSAMNQQRIPVARTPQQISRADSQTATSSQPANPSVPTQPAMSQAPTTERGGSPQSLDPAVTRQSVQDRQPPGNAEQTEWQAKPPTTDEPPTNPGNTVDLVRDPRAVETIVKKSLAHVQSTNCYSVFVTKQERLAGRLSQAERTLLTFRREPFSVGYVWQDGRNDGRQCVFVLGKNDNKIVSKGGKADFLMAGRIMHIDPEGMLAKARGHYSIRETGIEIMLNRLATTIAQQQQGDQSAGTAAIQGIVRHPDLASPSLLIVNQIPANVDSALTKGAMREWYFDPASYKLLLVLTYDPNRTVLEQYYRYDDFTPIQQLPDSVFTLAN